MCRNTCAAAAVAVCCWLAAGCTERPAADSAARVARDAAEGTATAPARGAAAPAAPAPTSDEPPRGRLGGDVVPNHYTLDLRIDPRDDRFEGVIAIDVDVARSTNRVWLHGLGLDVSEAFAIDAAGARIPASYAERLPSGVASLTLERALTAGSASLHLTYSAPFNRSVNALFRADRGNDAYVASQLEPIAGRQIFPGFDEPRFKTPWNVSITTRAEYVAITNAPELSATPMQDGWVRHEFAATAPLPTYLLAFAVGPYEVVEAGEIPVNAIRARAVPLRGAAARGMGSRFAYALRDTPAVLGALEEYFGTAYPYGKLDLIAMPQSFGGAMENAGAVTYDETLILLDADASVQQRRAYLNVHAHELAHMWFGDLVTPAWWNDIWLNESFASWMANKIARRHWPEGEFDRATLADALDAMAADSLATARQIREPVERNEEIEDAFDSITYEKGGGVLAMFEGYLGDAAFRAGVRLHLERFAHGVATADDFIASLAEASGEARVEAAFRSFIEQPGVPLVEAALQCDAGRAPRVALRQRRYAPLGSSIDGAAYQWHVPVCLAYDTADGRERTCELMTARELTIELGAGECPAAVHPNAGGAGYYRFTLDRAGWSALTASAAALEAAEALALVDSLYAGFRADTVSAGELIAGLATLAAHPAWDVAAATVDRFDAALDALAPADRPAAERVLRDIYRPRYDALAAAADEQALLLRSRLAQLLALGAHDTEVRATMADRAARYLRHDGTLDRGVVRPELLRTVLSVGVQELGEEFFDRLADAALASDDPAFRDDAFSALARVEAPELARALRADILAGRFPSTDATFMVLAQVSRPATQPATWEWIQQNAAAVMGLVPEFVRSQIFPRYGASLCSAQGAAELEALVARHAEALPGYDRSLRQAVESNALCVALRQAKSEELAAAFAGFAP